MRTLLTALILCSCAALAATDSVAAQAAKKKNVWTGVYTAAQAQRGEAVYKKVCTTCHSPDLRGKADGGPPLRDADFFTRWGDTTLSEMVASIAELMPSDKPASLPRQQYVDVVTYLMKFNGIPPGATELPPDAAKLEQIVLTGKPK